MITVITPVYNADRFIDRCIESVISQPEVQEHILIEDGSDDDSLKRIVAWTDRSRKVRLLQHPDKGNHGRSESRNLGILQAKNELIAFLDADDFYLPNRFDKDLELLQSREIDGVYNAIGVEFYEDYSGPSELNELTTLNIHVDSSELFDHMTPIGDSGWFSGDGLLVRRSVFERTGLFNTTLQVAEDTDLWLKMALVANLIPGSLKEPVAKRGLHGKNVFHRQEYYATWRYHMINSVLEFTASHGLSEQRLKRIMVLRKQYLRKAGFNHPARTGFGTLIKIGLSKPVLWKSPTFRTEIKRSLRELANSTS